MATPERFFKEDPPHGLAKRLIYKKYLQAYIPIMLSDKSPYQNQNLTIFDGFAGPGTYECYRWPSDIEKYGSPIIALHVAVCHLWNQLRFVPTHPEPNKYEEGLVDLQKAQGERLKCEDNGEQTLTLVFVEPSKSNYKKLYKNVIHIMKLYGLKTKVLKRFESGFCTIKCGHPDDDDRYQIACKIYCAEFAQMVAPPCPSFALIDPFGYSQTPLDKVKDFIGIGKEAFINLMSSYINRFMETNPDPIADLFGFSFKESLDTQVLNGQTEVEDKIEMIVDTYENQLKSEARANFVINFEMRGSSHARLYNLVFATNHPKGLEQMKEAMNRGTQEANEGKFSLSDFMIVKKKKTLSFANDQDDGVVADDIFHKFAGRRGVRISEVENYILFNTLFVYRKKPLSLLEKGEKMTVRNGDQRARRNTYADHTEWILDFVEAETVQGE